MTERCDEQTWWRDMTDRCDGRTWQMAMTDGCDTRTEVTERHMWQTDVTDGHDGQTWRTDVTDRRDRQTWRTNVTDRRDGWTWWTEMMDRLVWQTWRTDVQQWIWTVPAVNQPIRWLLLGRNQWHERKFCSHFYNIHKQIICNFSWSCSHLLVRIFTLILAYWHTLSYLNSTGQFHVIQKCECVNCSQFRLL